jgi:hypothetical protein
MCQVDDDCERHSWTHKFDKELHAWEAEGKEAGYQVNLVDMLARSTGVSYSASKRINLRLQYQKATMILETQHLMFHGGSCKGTST